MFPVLSSRIGGGGGELNVQANLYSETLKNSIKLCLSGQFNLNNLTLARQHFKLDLGEKKTSPNIEIVKGIGLSMQQVRGSNPRLFNHDYLNQYGFIHKIKALTGEQREAIQLRLRKCLEMSVQGPTEIPLDWYNSMLSDLDREGLKYPSGEVPSMLQFLDRENLTFKDISRPVA
jgi:hypothetical protein